jgi:tetratricopeptide (TPR) repeat protein
LDKSLKKYTLFLLLSTFLMFVSGCTLPRITVLKDPLTPEEHLNLGLSYEQKGELDPAIKEYLLAARQLPKAYLYLGNVYFLKKEWVEAERDYKQAIQKDPQDADAYNNLAWLYYNQGEKLREAERLALKAMELNPAKERIYRDTLEKIRGKISSSSEG